MEGENIPIPALSNDAPGQPLPLAVPLEEKKKRHRRTKAELEAARKKDAGEATPEDTLAQQIKEASAALSTTFQVVGAIVAGKRGEHWQIEKKEADRLGDAWAVVLAPYLPKVGQALPVVGALVVTWGVVQPRIEEDGRQKKAKMLRDGPALVDDSPPPVTP